MNAFVTRYLLVVGLLYFAFSLQAQQEKVKSTWTVGLELSTSLHMSTRKDLPPDRSYNHQIVGAKAGYRLLRWLEPWVRLQRHNIAATPHMVWAHDYGDIPGGLVTRHYRMDIYSLMFGAAVMIRIGQGDLGLSTGIGISRRTGFLQATDATGAVTSASFVPSYEPRRLLQLDYTYWPTERFGIRIGVSHSSSAQRFIFEKVRLVNFTNESEGVFINESMRSIGLAPDKSRYLDTWQLGLGVDYRL